VGKSLFIKNHCTVNCTIYGGIVCCSPRHRHLSQGSPFPATKVPRLQGEGLHPRLRTPDTWVVMPWRWGYTRELAAQPSQQGLLARAPSVRSCLETQLSWVRTQTPNPKQTLLGPTPEGPKPQSHWVRP
jgi:hypothetical protein